jgi:hypothetical protein
MHNCFLLLALSGFSCHAGETNQPGYFLAHEIAGWQVRSGKQMDPPEGTLREQIKPLQPASAVLVSLHRIEFEGQPRTAVACASWTLFSCCCAAASRALPALRAVRCRRGAGAGAGP